MTKFDIIDDKQVKVTVLHGTLTIQRGTTTPWPWGAWSTDVDAATTCRRKVLAL